MLCLFHWWTLKNESDIILHFQSLISIQRGNPICSTEAQTSVKGVVALSSMGAYDIQQNINHLTVLSCGSETLGYCGMPFYRFYNRTPLRRIVPICGLN